MTNIQINMQGFVTWQVGREGEKPRLTSGDEPTCNLIVNNGLDLMGTNASTVASAYCRVGTGTGATTPTMTDLVARFGAVSGEATGRVDTNSGAAPWWHQTSRTYTFTAGTISGAALTEMGFYNFFDSNSMFSRVLFLDGLGNPTSVTLLPDEVLTVSYAIRKYVPMTDATGTFNITGVGTIDYTVRAANANSGTAWGAGSNVFIDGGCTTRETQTLGAITSQPAGGRGDSNTFSNSAYANGTYQRSVSASWQLASANFPTGIGSMSFFSGSQEAYQISFTPKIPKDATKTLNMSNFFTVSWAAGAP